LTIVDKIDIILSLEKNMSIDTAYLIILVGSVYLAWTWGKKEGINNTLDYMKAQGHIDFEDE